MRFTFLCLFLFGNVTVPVAKSPVWKVPMWPDLLCIIFFHSKRVYVAVLFISDWGNCHCILLASCQLKGFMQKLSCPLSRLRFVPHFMSSEVQSYWWNQNHLHFMTMTWLLSWNLIESKLFAVCYSDWCFLYFINVLFALKMYKCCTKCPNVWVNVLLLKWDVLWNKFINNKL